MEVKRVIYSRLNRPATRRLLELLATSIKSVVYRRPCRVRYADGQWIHEHPDGVLVEREIHLATMSKLDSMTRDHWFYQYAPQSGDIVVDVGAGTGWEAKLCSRLVGNKGRVIAIEAHPATFACLAKMVQLNGLTNITPLFCAVSDRPGVVHISDGTLHQGNSIVSNTDGVAVPARTLEEICSTERIEHIDLLKMNIEGAERIAVPSLGRFAERTRYVVISCHDFLADWGQSDEFRSLEQVSQWLSKAGFSLMRRANDERAWVRDYVYGQFRSLIEAPGPHA
jgi:FkbM family methyltransferase